MEDASSMAEKSVAGKPAQSPVWSWAGLDSAWALAELAITHLTRVLLWGPPGVGKSFLAARRSSARFQVTLSDDLSVQELMGHFVPEGNVFRWHQGPVLSAFKDGGLLVLNEIGRASGAVQDFLLGILDGNDVARITLPTGEHVEPDPAFLVIATSNAAPQHLDPAIRSRFEAEVHLPEPHPDLSAVFENAMPGLGAALRDSFADPDRALDPRRVQSFLRLRASQAPIRAAAVLAFGERAPDVFAALSSRGIDLS
jgi:MoxR-like ATPase